MLEKLLNKLGYVKYSNLIQPVIIQNDNYKCKTLRTKTEFLAEEIANVPNRSLIETTVMPLAEQLPELCEITQIETYRGTYEIEATLRVMEREKGGK